MNDCFFLDFVGNSTKFQEALKIISCVLISLLVLPTILLNGLVIVTIWRTPSLRSVPSNILLLCLACADFLNGLITQPLAAIHLAGELTWNDHLFCIPGVVMESVAWFASGISATTVLALSVDRFLAVYMHLRYNDIVTVFRTSIFAMGIWPLFTVNVLTRFAETNSLFVTRNVVLIVLCLLAIVVIYYKIFKIVNYHRVQIQAQVESTSHFTSQSPKSNNESIARKPLVTVVYVVGSYWLSYLPFSCVLVSYLIVGITPSIRTAYCVAATIVFANSVINPGLYCWRISEIRQALLKSVRKVAGKGHT